MIEMLEGVPGSGKSYHAVAEKLVPWLRAGRRLYVAIDGIYLDRLAAFENRTIEDLHKQLTCWVTKDDVLEGLLTVEPGAAVLIDEAQTIFRSKEKLSPELLRWLETHRHRGNDVVLMVQAAAQCTLGVLRLVEVTTKFRRLDRFGLKGRYQAMVRGNPEETETIRMYTGRYQPALYAYYSSYSSAAVREQTRTGSIFKSPTVVLGVLGLCLAGAWFAGGRWLSAGPVASAPRPSVVAVEIPRAPLRASASEMIPASDPDDVVPEPVRIVGGMEFDEDAENSWRWISDTGEIFTEDELLVRTNFHVESVWVHGTRRVQGSGVIWGGRPAPIQESTGLASAVPAELRTIPTGPALGGSESLSFVNPNAKDLLVTPPDLR
ncbi:MAG: zonular occludens toxin domain-containing protein [Nitrospira sp.]|nr:zonular occludens toxin domain-containing protein [Nitrospira sp.]